jgi:hypothetical protein
MAPPGREPTNKVNPFSGGQAGATRAQVGKQDILRDLNREMTRKEYFKGRQDISDDRLDRRLKQAQEYQDFKNTLNVAEGTTNLYQASKPVFDTDPSSPTFGQYVRTTLADKAMQLANKYGPTPTEIMGDIGYGIKSIASGIGERVATGNIGLLGIAKGLYDQFTNNATKAKDALVKGFDKLTSVEQEIAKDTSKYPKMSSHPRIQGIKDIEEYQMTELDKANTIRNNMETLSSISIPEGSSIPVTTTSRYGMPQSPPGFKVMSQQQKDLLREMNEYDMRRAQDKFRGTPGSGYQAGAGLPAITNNIQIQGGQATPITDQEFMEKEKQANEIFNDPFFSQTSNQMSGAPGFEIVTDYKNPNQRMQELIDQNKINNTKMFDLGINNAKNQLSELERVFGVDMR